MPMLVLGSEDFGTEIPMKYHTAEICRVCTLTLDGSHVAGSHFLDRGKFPKLDTVTDTPS